MSENTLLRFWSTVRGQLYYESKFKEVEQRKLFLVEKREKQKAVHLIPYFLPLPFIVISFFQPKAGQTHYENLCMKPVNQSIGEHRWFCFNKKKFETSFFLWQTQYPGVDILALIS